MHFTSLAPIALVAAIATGSPAIAEDAARNYMPRTGGELVELLAGCESQSCMSYVYGAVNGASLYAYLVGSPSPFCATETIPSSAIRDAIIETIEGSPRLKRTNPVAGILAAFNRNWPCPTTNAAASVTSETDDVDETGDLLTWHDLPAIDADALARFVDADSHALSLGNPDAPTDMTLRVFIGPECETCDLFMEELDQLAAKGWHILVHPVAISDDRVREYVELMYALRDVAPDAAEAIYRNHDDRPRNAATAISIATDAGADTGVIVRAYAESDAPRAIEANNAAFMEFGGSDLPAWILEGRIAFGIIDAAEIERIRETARAAPTDMPAPAARSDDAARPRTRGLIIPDHAAE